MYLGVVIDSRLSMIGHISNNIRKAKKALIVIRYAACQNITLNSLVSLVRSTVLSRLEYGLHVCCPISDNQFKRMDMLLNQALRVISGAAQKTSGEALKYYLGFYSIKQLYNLKAGKELVRAATTQSHPLFDVLRETASHTDVRLKIVKPWSSVAMNIIENIVPINLISSNIWVPYNDKRLAIDIVGSREWRDRNPIINQAEVEQYIESVNVNIIIATDGSVREDVTAWAGLVWKNNRCIYKWCAGKHGRTSSFRAEMEGVEDALFWMSNNTSVQDTTLLLTDSKSLVAQLQSGMVKNTWLKLLRKIKSSIRIAYIPGHAGITYNEAADHLAGMAEPFGHITFYQQDITNRLKENLNNDNAPKKTWWSFQRMKERAIKFGDGGRKTTRLSNTKAETQEIMGLITKNTLTNILKKGWPESYIS
ncbi:uncharacterized protein LOC110238129 [Exaiptasia diaphana]|uniref:RNase H type-1 domain-containing protein n=1 Tax=Exaiptasia diaphana TaxID=2652724 RepID=A0A913YGX1_EXADI|nr:uncharacterized protein LOC110238129 [Exaiptasia diaphana]